MNMQINQVLYNQGRSDIRMIQVEGECEEMNNLRTGIHNMLVLISEIANPSRPAELCPDNSFRLLFYVCLTAVLERSCFSVSFDLLINSSFFLYPFSQSFGDSLSFQPRDQSRTYLSRDPDSHPGNSVFHQSSITESERCQCKASYLQH